MKKIVTLVGLLALSLVPASPPARADDASYLGALGYHIWPADAMLRAGHWTCDQIRSGQSTDQVIASAPPTTPLAFDLPSMVHAAQHELCPDTL